MRIYRVMDWHGMSDCEHSSIGNGAAFSWGLRMAGISEQPQENTGGYGNLYRRGMLENIPEEQEYLCHSTGQATENPAAKIDAGPNRRSDYNIFVRKNPRLSLP